MPCAAAFPTSGAFRVGTRHTANLLTSLVRCAVRRDRGNGYGDRGGAILNRLLTLSHAGPASDQAHEHGMKRNYQAPTYGAIDR